jgi:hypothetical protein
MFMFVIYIYIYIYVCVWGRGVQILQVVLLQSLFMPWCGRSRCPVRYIPRAVLNQLIARREKQISEMRDVTIMFVKFTGLKITVAPDGTSTVSCWLNSMLDRRE